MVLFQQVWPLTWAVPVFLLASALVFVLGPRLTALADGLADKTGLGEALIGSVVLGALTSLPGITASVSAAVGGSAQLALSNAYGGIAAQTLFLAVADVAYRKANLEHAAASLENIVFCSTIVVLLGMNLWAMAAPQYTLWSVHPATILILIAYPFFLKVARDTRESPGWKATKTKLTVVDQPDNNGKEQQKSLKRLIAELAIIGSAVVVAGWALSRSGDSIGKHWGIDESVVGALGVAIATSTPELVTSIAAVRRGALTLAVGGIMGGNAFDSIFAAVSDLFYRDGSIYAAASAQESSLIVLSILMTGVIIAGLARRQERGPGRIGFESVILICAYIGGMLWITLGGEGSALRP